MKKALILLVLATAVIVSASLMPRDRDGGNPAADAESYMEDVIVTSKRSSEHLWSLSAKRAVFSRNSKTATLQSITLLLPRESLTVEAESGTYDIDTRELSLVGGVRAQAEDFVIETGAIDVLTDSEEIYSAEKVRLESGEFTIEGVGLRAKGDGRIRLLGAVNATFF